MGAARGLSRTAFVVGHSTLGAMASLVLAIPAYIAAVEHLNRHDFAWTYMVFLIPSVGLFLGLTFGLARALTVGFVDRHKLKGAAPFLPLLACLALLYRAGVHPTDFALMALCWSGSLLVALPIFELSDLQVAREQSRKE